MDISYYLKGVILFKMVMFLEMLGKVAYLNDKKATV